MLRTEAATNNVNDYGIKKAVEHLPKLRERLASINDNYLNVQQDILETLVDRGQLRQLAAPSILPNGKRIPGLKLDHHAVGRQCRAASASPAERIGRTGTALARASRGRTKCGTPGRSDEEAGLS
jgi:hypothetical protein